VKAASLAAVVEGETRSVVVDLATSSKRSSAVAVSVVHVSKRDLRVGKT
jgi:hypothetical protein